MAAIIADARTQPYVLGEHDCFRLACRVIEALTGVCRWPEFAGYKSKGEALRIIARHGRTFEAAFDWFFGAPSIGVNYARRGDCVALELPRGEHHLGVVTGKRFVCLAEQGLIELPVTSALCAWRVG